MRLASSSLPFDELADPALVARLCAEAEEAGWDGAFVWDQVRRREPVAAVGDPQIILAAIGLEILAVAWSGDRVTYRGQTQRVDGVTFLSRPVQRPRIPIWVGGTWPRRAPLRRALR